jgi:hypothetical protein
MEVSGQLQVPAALPPGKEPLVPTECLVSVFKITTVTIPSQYSEMMIKVKKK